MTDWRAQKPAASFAPRTVKWLFPIAGLGLLVTAAWALLAEPPIPTTGGANAYSRSAIGYEALSEALDDAGMRVMLSRWRSGKRAGPDAPVLALEPLPEFEGEVGELLTQAEQSGAVVVLGLPKWDAEETSAGWVSIVSLTGVERAGSTLSHTSINTDTGLALLRPEAITGWTGLPPGDAPVLPYHPQLLPHHAALTPIISADQGVLIGKLSNHHGVELYVVSDPDLWNTHGLNNPANAELVGWFVSEHLGVDTVIIDEVIHGYERAPSIWRELVSWPLNLFTLHLTILLGLAIAAAAGRMGRPLPPPLRPGMSGPGLEGLLDNTAQLLAQGGYAAYAVRRYFRMTTRDLAGRLSLPPGLDFEEKLVRLDSLERSDRSCAAIWRAMGKLPERKGATRRALTLARATWTWREEMLNVR